MTGSKGDKDAAITNSWINKSVRLGSYSSEDAGAVDEEAEEDVGVGTLKVPASARKPSDLSRKPLHPKRMNSTRTLVVLGIQSMGTRIRPSDSEGGSEEDEDGAEVEDAGALLGEELPLLFAGLSKGANSLANEAKLCSSLLGSTCKSMPRQRNWACSIPEAANTRLNKISVVSSQGNKRNIGGFSFATGEAVK